MGEYDPTFGFLDSLLQPRNDVTELLLALIKVESQACKPLEATHRNNAQRDYW